MKIKIRNFWYRLQASFWFLPALLAAAAISVTIAIVMSLLSLGVLIYFIMIRQNSQSVAAVSIHLLETIATVAAQTIRKEDRAALLRHAANGRPWVQRKTVSG